MTRQFLRSCLAGLVLGCLCVPAAVAAPSTAKKSTKKSSKKQTQKKKAKKYTLPSKVSAAQARARWKKYRKSKKRKNLIVFNKGIIVNGRRQVPKVVYILDRTKFKFSKTKLKPKGLVSRIVGSVKKGPF